MGIGYSMISDLLSLMVMCYVPAMYMLKQSRYGKYISYFSFVGLYSIYVYLFRYIWIPETSFLYMAGSICLLWLLYRFFYRDGINKRILAWCYTFLIAILTDVISSVLLVFIANGYIEKYVSAYFEDTFVSMMRLMGLLVGETCAVIAALIYLCLILFQYKNLFWGFILVPIYQCFLIVGFFMLCENFTERAAQIGMAMGCFNLILDVMMLYFLEELFKKMKVQDRMAVMEVQRQKELEFYQSESQSVEQMRLIRHDFMNQLQTAYSMMDEPENADKVKDMIGQMKERLEE